MKSSTLPMLTIADLEATPDDGNRYEIIDGELFVSSAPSYHHQNILGNIYLAFREYLKANPIGRVAIGVGVIFDDNNGVVPDLVFVIAEREKKILREGRLQAAPDIAIEILSPGSSNTRRDRRVKLDLYSARGVGEYWIVDPDAEIVEVYRGSADGLQLVENLGRGDRLGVPLLPGFSVSTEEFFRK